MVPRAARMPAGRHFVLLQMPCGRFGPDLQRALRNEGHRATRVAINGGDLMSGLRGRTVVYTRSLADFPYWIKSFVESEGVTDVILYGDCRPYHRTALAALAGMNIALHVLEEGYLRPNWVTCERNGVNGNSVLTAIDLDRIAEFSAPPISEKTLKASNMSYAMAAIRYYFWTWLFTPMFPRYTSHRDLDIIGELSLWIQRVCSWPIRKNRAERTFREIARFKKPVHLVLLQLNGDSQIKVHSGFQSTRHFIEYCISEFKASGVHEGLLVFKNHPLDSGVINLRRVIAEESRKHGLEHRIFFIETGKLVPLLEQSVSVVSINSTACHQALRRGIPTLVLGRAVFNHPQVVSSMRLADFFKLRPVKAISAYEKLVALMRETCQFNGGFYTEEGRKTLVPSLTRGLLHGRPEARSFEVDSKSDQISKQAS
jgi:capsular polysaccharide export protein